MKNFDSHIETQIGLDTIYVYIYIDTQIGHNHNAKRKAPTLEGNMREATHNIQEILSNINSGSLIRNSSRHSALRRSTQGERKTSPY